MQETDSAGTLDAAAVTVTPAGPVDDDPEDLDDQAAELDDQDADPVDGDPVDADPEHDDGGDGDTVAVCRGGPYDGRTVTSRFPKGFILVDKEHGNVFVYDTGSAGFTCRTPAGVPLDDEGRWRASEESTYDVIAFDPDTAEEVHP